MKTSTSGSSWLANMKHEREILELRREALNISRKIIEGDPRFEGLTSYEIELAACDLCDKQVKEMLFIQGATSCQ